MRPSRLLVGLTTLGLALQFAALFVAGAWLYLWYAFAALAIVALVDAAIGLRLNAFVASRWVASSVVVDSSVEVSISIDAAAKFPRTIFVADGVPSSFEQTAFPIRVELVAEGQTTVRYVCRPTLRGLQTFSRGRAWWTTRLGLWERHVRIAEETTVRVVPQLPQDAKGTWFLERGRQGSGNKNVRRRGHGLEFYQLREYREGDLKRLIDAKATSRLRKLVVREYQEEQNQDIVFVLDTGYRMTAHDERRSHFDRVLEALLTLASTALRQGDSVGVLVFGPIERWIPPMRGPGALQRLRQSLYDVEAQGEPSSPSATLELLLTKLRRRALVVLLSNLREEDGIGLVPSLRMFLERHVLLTLWLRESVHGEILSGDFRTLESALTAAAARNALQARHHLQKLWTKQGVLVLDTEPQKLTASLVSRYWEIKKQGRL